MMLRELTKDTHANSFFDQKYSFITADHVYIDWTKEKLPGTSPLFVLPSVWYSIMLKYHGRTDDDYAAFCQFINLRISDIPDERQEEKNRMLAYVMRLDESSEVKDEIAFDIAKRLSETENYVDDAETFVKESHERVTEGRVAAAIAEADMVHEQRMADVARVHKQRIQDEYEKGREKGHQEGQREGIEQGRLEGRKEIIRSQAEQKAKINRGIHVVTICIGILCVVVFAGLLIIQYCIGENSTAQVLKFVEEHGSISMILSGSGILLSGLFSRLEKHVSFFSTDVEELEKKMMEKLKNNVT